MASTPDKPGTTRSPTGSKEHLPTENQRQSLASTLRLGEEDKPSATRLDPRAYSGIKTSTPSGSKAGSMEDLTSSRYTTKSQNDDLSDQNHYNQSAFQLVNIDFGELDLLSQHSYATSIGGYSVPDLTSGLMSSHHHRHTGSHSHRQHRDFRRTGASLPASRTASPDPDQILGGSRKKAAFADVSKYLVEKEVLESQLRKLQVENSTLQTENKLLKEKHKRGQVRITQLETQVRDVQREALSVSAEIGDEVSVLTQRARDRSDHELSELRQKMADITLELDMVKDEKVTLKKQLESARWTTDSTRSKPSERSRIIESYKVENFCLKDEVRQVRRLLEESERVREDEAEKRREASVQVVRLTEIKALLQQQLEQVGGGSVAERQVKSLERRLKITEERLHHERADRANKLSDMEEKLISENARLQVAEKELKRQLTREREKQRTTEQKYKDTRDENERLRVQIAETHLVSENSGIIKLRTGQRKHADDLNRIMEQIKKDDNLGAGQEHDMIWLLWQRNAALTRQLKEWEIALDEVKVDHGNVTHGLKLIRDDRGLFEDRIARYKDTLEDVSKEKDEIETILHGKIKDLTQAYHGAIAQARNVEDVNAGITAENESLRSSLRQLHCPTTSTCSRDIQTSTAEAQLESLRSRLRTAEGASAQHSRSERLLESEVSSLRTQLTTKDAALEEALGELDRLHAGHLDGGDLLDVKQQQIEKLTIEVRGLQREVCVWQDKLNSANTEREQLEQQVKQLTKSRSKLTVPASHMAESDKLALETELHEKDSQVLQLSIRYNECENDLQRTKRQLAASQQHTEQLDQQLDQLQTQLRQKTRLLERMTSTEGDHMAQMKALRENLTSANRELSDKTTQMRRSQLEHEQIQTKLQRLESDSLGSVVGASLPGNPVNAQQRLLEYERESARRDLDRANTVMNLIIQENAELLGRIRELRQDLVKERAQLCQLSSEKLEAEQQLYLCHDDCDMLNAQKARLMADLSRVVAGNNQDISTLEADAGLSTVDYQQKYPTLNADGKKMAVELGTVHRLLEARMKESQILRDTIERQKSEVQSMNRKAELLNEELLTSRDNIERLTNHLTLKMQENAASLEASHSLAAEKTRLQMEKLQLEKDVGQGGSEMDRRITEIHDLTRKLDKADNQCRDAERKLHQKETALVALETELKHLNRNNHMLDTERAHLKAQVDKAHDETCALRKLNTTLEQQLSTEKNTLTEEKSSRGLMNQELTSVMKEADVLRHDNQTIKATLETERRNLQNLQMTLQREEDKVYALEDQVKTQRLELETLTSHLTENRNTIDQYKKDKQTLYQDVQELCRKLAEKDDAMSRLQEKCNDALDHAQRDSVTEKSYMTKERAALELDLAKTKEEVEELSGKLKLKELQLEAYLRTNSDLDAERCARQDAEGHVTHLEVELAEARRTLTTLQMDNSRKADQSKHLEENLEKAYAHVAQLKEMLQAQREQYTSELSELRHTLTEEMHRHEVERSDLSDQLNQTISELRTKEVTLSSVSETRTKLYESSRGLEKTVDSLRRQLHEEITARKLAEQKNDSYKTQMEDLKTKRGNLDEQYMELQAILVKVETELNLEKDKYRRLKQEFSDERSTSSTVEAHALVLHTQVTELQAEVSSLRTQLETQKQNLQGKNKRLVLDMKQQTENFDQERSKLVLQSEQLASDFDLVREQVATKNREQLKLQEDVLTMEEKLREATSRTKHATESLRIEEQHREKLELKNQELELKFRFRTDADSESSKLEATKAEIAKRMAEMEKKMVEQMESNKNMDKEAVARTHKQMEEYKKRVAVLESNLSQEQAMHLVTKTQLSSLDEDNQRLRQQLQAARKRTAPISDEKSKSRMEEINEIIARSQTRAQQLMAAGVYGADDPLRSTGRDLLSPIPMMHHLNISGMSDNRSVVSDDLSRDISRDLSKGPH